MLLGWQGISYQVSIQHKDKGAASKTNFGTGLYEFVRKGDPPVMGITKMEAGVTLKDMKRPRLNPPPKLPLDITASRLSATTPP